MASSRPRFALLGALGTLAALFVAARNLERFEIDEDSMLPELSAGDYVVTSDPRGALKPGDIVVFQDPDLVGYYLVKRVVAGADSTVNIVRGSVAVNDRPEEWGVGPTPGKGLWHVGRDQVFVLGDLRSRSGRDSRELGPIAASSCRRVVLRYWPLSAWRYF